MLGFEEKFTRVHHILPEATRVALVHLCELLEHAMLIAVLDPRCRPTIKQVCLSDPDE